MSVRLSKPLDTLRARAAVRVSWPGSPHIRYGAHIRDRLRYVLVALVEGFALASVLLSLEATVPPLLRPLNVIF
jgi:hypothetical protein